MNFHESEIFFFGAAQESLSRYTELFGHNQGPFQMRYLGIPIHYKRLSNMDWKRVEECFETRLSS